MPDFQASIKTFPCSKNLNKIIQIMPRNAFKQKGIEEVNCDCEKFNLVFFLEKAFTNNFSSKF